MAKAGFGGARAEAAGIGARREGAAGGGFYSRHGKRLLDLAVAVPLFLLVLPLIAVLALATLTLAGWPPFFAARRAGLNGRQFTMWKVRTMINGAEAVLQRWLDSNPDLAAEYRAHQKLHHDPRMTRIGSGLRRLSLDELPQLWNVIRGEMSLVGPRPYIAGELAEHASFKDSLSRARPGLTGPWQVSGRNQVSPLERIEMDRHYLENISLDADLSLLAKTVRTLVRPNGL